MGLALRPAHPQRRRPRASQVERLSARTLTSSYAGASADNCVVWGDELISPGSPEGSSTATADGTRMVKAEPRPTSLSTEMPPPIKAQSFWLKARPSPVPPYLLEVDAATCPKFWNSFGRSEAEMPIPVSRTWISIQSAAWFLTRFTVTAITPSFVNFAALLRRLMTA